MKQETLYEAFLNCLINKEFKTKEDYIAFKGAEFGAKWQRERSYSEEEVKFIISEALQSALVNNNLELWFNIFKKK